ncbi:RNA polymerase sigma factor (plasmid) [Streptomyces viridifaciens]|nr:RNA polymerase sigma factor [Streptomyces viridifaciens]
MTFPTSLRRPRSISPPGTDTPATTSARSSHRAALSAPVLPDDVLAIRSAEGDEDAFALLVKRHTPALLALAYHLMGSLPDAEEAVQDAFTSAWQCLPSFRHQASFHTWIYRITVNCCLNAKRRHRSALPLHTVPEPTDPDPVCAPSAAAETAALARALLTALGRLPDHQRTCWVLYELHGLSYRDICHITGVPEPTVRGRLFRARRSLQEAMAPWR